MIQIYLLTGFLGAGKTTLLQTLLRSYEGRKIGVIVNEFGEINVDARLIESNGVEMAELSNGSIFCACIKDKFVESLVELSRRDLEFLFIEASGLADPANMAQILDGIKPYTTNEYLLRGSICVVDGNNFLDLLDLLPALENQVAYANAVIINKADLIDEVRVNDIKQAIQKINSGVSFFVTTYCNIDIRQITDNFTVSLKKSVESTNTYESRPKSFVLTANEQIPFEGLSDFIKEVVSESYRIKGFADTDKGPMEISTVSNEIQIRPWKEHLAETEIVVISSTGIKMLSRLLSESQKYLEGRLKLK